MATRTCPTCGTQYVATVRSCIDCGAALVADTSSPPASEAKSTTTTSTSSGEREQIGYELPGWGNQLKVALKGMLDGEGVPHVWGVNELLVPAEFEATADRLIEAVEGGELVEPGDDEAQVALEIEGLDQDIVDDLEARLLANAVPHVWSDDGELLVAEADEERVLELIDAAFDAAEEHGDGDASVQDVLSALYVSVDRLANRPGDRKRIDAFLAAAEVVPTMAVPYGFAAKAWAEVVDETTALVALVRDDEDDEEAAPEADEDRPDTDTDAEDESETDDEPGLDDLVRSLRDHLREIV